MTSYAYWAASAFLPKALLTTVYPDKEELERLTNVLDSSEDYATWKEAALSLDKKLGNNEWKEMDESNIYDYTTIRNRLAMLRYYKAKLSAENIQEVLLFLRNGMRRNFSGIGNPKLYEKCYFGTKQLIEEYTNETDELLRIICHSNFKTVSLQQKFEFFFAARQAYGRTALCLSGGATLGLYHLGVIKVLHDNDILPKIISGSSIGSIIASFVGTKTRSELSKMLENEFEDLQFEAFDSEGSLNRKLARLMTKGVLMDINKLGDCIRSNIGNVTFQEAYQRTGCILNITVCSNKTFDHPRLLNYITAPNVLVFSAALASCALAFLYEPVELQSKDENGNIGRYDPKGIKCSDGSVENDLPMIRLRELFNVNHFIVSQVNPHVIPFISSTDQINDSLLSKAAYCITSELKHRILQLEHLGLWPQQLNMLHNLVSQQYKGDITIVPNVGLSDYSQLLSNPTKAMMRDCLYKSQRETWRSTYTQALLAHETLRAFNEQLVITLLVFLRLATNPF